jgi:hypothetical protein
MVRENLQELYKYRGLAVHPEGKPRVPILHPELNVQLEQQYVQFRCTNAKTAVWLAIHLVHGLATRGKPAGERMRRYVESVTPRVKPLLERVEAFGRPQ